MVTDEPYHIIQKKQDSRKTNPTLTSSAVVPPRILPATATCLRVVARVDSRPLRLVQTAGVIGDTLATATGVRTVAHRCVDHLKALGRCAVNRYGLCCTEMCCNVFHCG